MMFPYTPSAEQAKKHKHTGDGWDRKIVQPFLEVVCLVDPSIPITQIKEKFGTLRIYHMGPEWVERLVDICEVASAECCEDCGSFRGYYNETYKDYANITTAAGPTGWIKTLCDGCRAVRQTEHDAEVAKRSLKPSGGVA